ncbi:Hypothetical predicted protein [Octopus vulgaris]|uniref:Uncharacterized protein n=1 Tax=Octopus vulgaris TaxID=6645 RepID=A0AA36AJT6_OCTVU|nr:Hypothetical predicted protein [Octopus vulgaris]
MLNKSKAKSKNKNGNDEVMREKHEVSIENMLFIPYSSKKPHEWSTLGKILVTVASSAAISEQFENLRSGFSSRDSADIVICRSSGLTSRDSVHLCGNSESEICGHP